MRTLSLKNVALLNIKNRRIFSFILIVFVGVLSCAVFISTYLIFSLKNGISSLKDRLGADVIVLPKGVEKKLEGALLSGTPESFYMDKSLMEKIPKENIEAMSVQLYIATLTLGCCSFPLQAIGIDEATDFVVRPWMMREVELPLKKSEIVVGYNIMAREGDSLKFFGHEYTVKAKLALTGMGFDNSVFLSIKDAREMAARARALTLIPSCEDENLISSILIKLKGERPRDFSIKLNKILKDDGATSFIATNMLSDISSKLKGLFSYIYVLLGVFCVLGISLITLTIFLNVAQRRSEYACLRGIGATKSYLFKLAILEMDILSFLGATAGSVLALIISLLFNSALKLNLNLPFLSPSFVSLTILFVANIFFSVLVVSISSFFVVLMITKDEIAIAKK